MCSVEILALDVAYVRKQAFIGVLDFQMTLQKVGTILLVNIRDLKRGCGRVCGFGRVGAGSLGCAGRGTDRVRRGVRKFI